MVKTIKAFFKIKEAAKEIALRSELFYYIYLKYKGAHKQSICPGFIPPNAVLTTEQEYKDALNKIKSSGLIPHIDLPKNWDSLGALYQVLKQTGKSASILDAGGQLYSVILPWLFLYGYKDLTSLDLAFLGKITRGPINYKYGDITCTDFKNASFDAVTCLSVIEHGVNVEEYFREMSRIIKPGGILITSVDYWESPVDTKGQVAFGVPIHIYTPDEILEAINVAKKYNFELVGDVELKCKDRVVEWNGLKFTFIYFTLRRKTNKDAS
ncbi:MAG: class I SAM-dependent methyltransferase [Pseudomonadota bacterium]